MHRKIPAAFLVAGLLAACTKPHLPDTPPAPKAIPDTQLRDAIQQPLEAAKAAAALEQRTAAQERQKIDDSTSPASSAPPSH